MNKLLFLGAVVAMIGCGSGDSQTTNVFSCEEISLCQQTDPDKVITDAEASEGELAFDEGFDQSAQAGACENVQQIQLSVCGDALSVEDNANEAEIDIENESARSLAGPKSYRVSGNNLVLYVEKHGKGS